MLSLLLKLQKLPYKDTTVIVQKRLIKSSFSASTWKELLKNTWYAEYFKKIKVVSIWTRNWSSFMSFNKLWVSKVLTEFFGWFISVMEPTLQIF